MQTDIWIDRRGRGGARILLLHGLGATAAVWSDFAALLDQQGIPCIAPDLPGHGASAPIGSYSIDAIATALAPSLEPENTLIVGHSLGAYVALALASGAFGIRAAGVLGIGPKISWSAADLAAIDELAVKPVRIFATEDEAIARYRKVSGLDARIAPSGATLARGISRRADGWCLACDPRTVLAGGSSFATLVQNARCPVTLARGEHDALVTLAELRQHCAAAVDMAGCGHNVHVEAPDSVLPLVRQMAAD